MSFPSGTVIYVSNFRLTKLANGTSWPFVLIPSITQQREREKEQSLPKSPRIQVTPSLCLSFYFYRVGNVVGLVSETPLPLEGPEVLCLLLLLQCQSK